MYSAWSSGRLTVGLACRPPQYGWQTADGQDQNQVLAVSRESYVSTGGARRGFYPRRRFDRCPVATTRVRRQALKICRHKLAKVTSDLTLQDRHLAAQDHDFDVLRRRAPAKQHEPAQDLNEPEIYQPQRHAADDPAERQRRTAGQRPKDELRAPDNLRVDLLPRLKGRVVILGMAFRTTLSPSATRLR